MAENSHSPPNDSHTDQPMIEPPADYDAGPQPYEALPPFAPPSASPPKPGEVMQTVADTVGFVPSLRKSDNLFQLAFVLISAAVGVWIGYDRAATNGAILFALLFAFLGLIVSGALIGVAGLIRTIMKK